MASALELLEKANIYFDGFPYSSKSVGLVKRWKTPIAVKTCGDERAEKALDEIEKRLGAVFDRKSLADLPDDEITSGIIFCFGQAGIDMDYASQQNMTIDDIKNTTGNVSCGPGEKVFPRHFLSDDGLIACRLYINLDNVYGRKASIDIAIHEMGHAMGLGASHFEGFGDDMGPISDRFWDVLKLLYELPYGKYAAE